MCVLQYQERAHVPAAESHGQTHRYGDHTEPRYGDDCAIVVMLRRILFFFCFVLEHHHLVTGTEVKTYA